MKRFKNLWSMGLIICGVILGVLYLAKLLIPQFVVGVAELDSVVKFGNYVDSHVVVYYIFNFIVSMFTYYFYCCACCRKRNLTIWQFVIVGLANVLLFIIQALLPLYYLSFNMLSLIVLPCIICLMDKRTDIKYLYSTTTTFSIHIVAQFLSLNIRDIVLMLRYDNTATFTIMLIDGFIWLVLLYNYYNYKEVKNG